MNKKTFDFKCNQVLNIIYSEYERLNKDGEHYWFNVSNSFNSELCYMIGYFIKKYTKNNKIKVHFKMDDDKNIHLNIKNIFYEYNKTFNIENIGRIIKIRKIIKS